MIHKLIALTTEQRLNSILDKILANCKLSTHEITFLDSYKLGTEEQVNQQMNHVEGRIYLSDNGSFKFIFKEFEEQEDCIIITGTLLIPDPLINGLVMKSTGNILVFNRNHIALDFRINEIDIFEFIPGKEEELDDFITEIIEDTSR